MLRGCVVKQNQQITGISPFKTFAGRIRTGEWQTAAKFSPETAYGSMIYTITASGVFLMTVEGDHLLVVFTGLFSSGSIFTRRNFAAGFAVFMFGQRLFQRRSHGKQQQKQPHNGQIKQLALDPASHAVHLLWRNDAYFSASPSFSQAAMASSSGVSWQITLSQTSTAPAVRQSSSQLRIHSPSPQP